MNKVMKKFLSLILAVFTALSCFVFASAADVKYGDVNQDAKVNSSDALLVLQHSVKSIELKGDQFTAADVNADGSINATDALLVLQYSVGMISSFPAEGIPVPKTAAEILALYAKTVDKTRKEIPAYKLKSTSKGIEADVSGTALSMMTKKEIQDMKDSMLQESTYQNLFKQGSTAALSNLPAVCTFTDVSKFKSITCKVLADGNYQIDITFNDDANPKAGSPIVKMFNLPDEATFVKTVKDEFTSNSSEDFTLSGDMLDVDMEYKNCSISCVINPKTGEFVSYKSAYDMKSVINTVILVFSINTATTARNITEYSNFIY